MRAIASCLFLTACIGPWPGTVAEPVDPNVGFVYIGPIGDHGWSKSHDDGRLALEADLGVPTQFEESVIPADAAGVMDGMIDNGANILFTTSFDFVSQTQQSAADHPEADFLNCSGNVHSANLSSYMGRMYQAIYIAGYVAGKMSCTGHLGIVTSVPIPETVRHVDAFTLGARRANPDVIVDVRWAMNWFDPVLEPVLTEELLAAGADVVLAQTDTTIPVEVANGRTTTCDDGSGPKESPVWTIGYDNADSCDHGTESCLTSAYWNWGPVYTDLVSDIAAGTWDPADVAWRPMTNSGDSAVGLAELSAKIPADIRFAISDVQDEVTDPAASQMPFVGKLVDNQGSVRQDASATMDDDTLNRICWFVDGVVDTSSGEALPAVVPNGCGGDI